MVFTSPLPDLDIPKTNILDYLFPKDVAVNDDPVWIDADNFDLHVSPKQVLQWIKRMIIGLDKLGLQKGDVCLIHTPNNVLVPAAYLGIVGGARCFSAINPIYTVDEIVHQMTLTNAKCLLVHPDLVERDLEAAKKAGTITPDRIFQFTDDAQPCKEKLGVKDWRHMLGSEEEAKNYRWTSLSARESETTIATINFSSGTTGMPKGVMISHHALIANVEQTAKTRWPEKDFSKGDRVTDERWIGFLPLYHAYGQMYANLMALKFQVPIYIMRQFIYEDYIRCIEKAHITDLQVAPPILVMMAKRPETAKYNLNCVRSIICGGAPLGKDLANEISRKFDCHVKQGWGMTEVTCGSILQIDPRDDGTVGRLIPNNLLKLVDDDGNEVGTDTPGEMWIKAPNVMLGYWKNEAATKETLTADGWLKTGDVAIINKEGFIWIVDRKKELIKVNALQVAPAELEGKLLTLDGVADAAAVGVTINDEEFPRAYVVLTEEAKKANVTPKQIQDAFKPLVAKHKALVGGVKFVDEIPKLASGKIQRKVMREWAKADSKILSKGFERAKL
ncbi:hypothetical protein DOTSEDRAFT_73577 [Dothistroma septosporum NZE10]|uniref:AMP-dependent synthetase/ligase domain-containing protein n=1 Tax=Dothistroma septosporum (strain NZE10 / CBS 128990) TaxID=675120 RepID=N1PI55_DOTSN|nr:hypothetical protein DOTSEDRAFT_73577 [Dothistroma septosporum NZE10]